MDHFSSKIRRVHTSRLQLSPWQCFLRFVLNEVFVQRQTVHGEYCLSWATTLKDFFISPDISLHQLGTRGTSVDTCTASQDVWLRRELRQLPPLVLDAIPAWGRQGILPSQLHPRCGCQTYRQRLELHDVSLGLLKWLNEKLLRFHVKRY